MREIGIRTPRHFVRVASAFEGRSHLIVHLEGKNRRNPTSCPNCPISHRCAEIRGGNIVIKIEAGFWRAGDDTTISPSQLVGSFSTSHLSGRCQRHTHRLRISFIHCDELTTLRNWGGSIIVTLLGN